MSVPFLYLQIDRFIFHISFVVFHFHFAIAVTRTVRVFSWIVLCVTSVTSVCLW
jgi:hypothetical protein